MLHSDNIETGMPGGMKVDELLPFVTEVVSAQLANNKTASANVAPLIQSVYKALHELRANGTPAALPAKRYLRNTYGMTPDEYRKRWALPADYPMVAPKYAEKRSKIA